MDKERLLTTTNPEVVRASELGDRVVQRIFELRNPEAMPSYRRDLARYKKRLGKKTEGTLTETSFFSKRTFRGFQVERLGQTITVERPTSPSAHCWSRHHYDRDTSSLGMSFYAMDAGLLADGGLYNRPIRETRVDEYAREMEEGRWRDLLSDPIAITSDGYLVNGQHRLAAASRIDWSADEYDPAFLVIWDVNPEEAVLADGSRRTRRDETIVARKLLDLDAAGTSVSHEES